MKNEGPTLTFRELQGNCKISRYMHRCRYRTPQDKEIKTKHKNDYLDF